MRARHTIFGAEVERLVVPLAVDIDDGIELRILRRWLDIFGFRIVSMSSFAFVVTSIFNASGKEAVAVLRGYIAHRLISFGIEFLHVIPACLDFA
jgi:hypothetical protein